MRIYDQFIGEKKFLTYVLESYSDINSGMFVKFLRGFTGYYNLLNIIHRLRILLLTQDIIYTLKQSS